MLNGRERLTEARPGRFVDPRDHLGGVRDRVDQVLPLCRQKRVARFELVELLDGHHVDGTKAIDLRFELRNRLFRGRG